MRFLLRVSLFVVALVAAAALVLAETPALRVGGLVLAETPALRVGGVVLLAGFLLICYAADWYAAWRNERHVARRPDLLRNDAIGERVSARGRFELRDGMAAGVVILNGERWKAYCPSHVPEDGELLTVRRREGLTLHVQPQGGAA